MQGPAAPTDNLCVDLQATNRCSGPQIPGDTSLTCMMGTTQLDEIPLNCPHPFRVPQSFLEYKTLLHFPATHPRDLRQPAHMKPPPASESHEKTPHPALWTRTLNRVPAILGILVLSHDFLQLWTSASTSLAIPWRVAYFPCHVVCLFPLWILAHIPMSYKHKHSTQTSVVSSFGHSAGKSLQSLIVFGG